MTWEVPKRTLKGTQADQARLGCQWAIELHAAGRVVEARNLWREHEKAWRLSDDEFDQLHDGPGSRNIPVYRMVADALCRVELDRGGAQLKEYARRQVQGEYGLALTEWGSGIYAVPTLAALSYYYHVSRSEWVGQLLRRLFSSYELFISKGGDFLVCPKERAKASTQDGERLHAWLLAFAELGDTLANGPDANGVNGWPERLTVVDGSLWMEDPEMEEPSLAILAGTTMKTEVHVIRDARGNVAAWSPHLIGSGSTAGQSAASFMDGKLYSSPLHPPNERAGKGKSLGVQGAEWHEEEGILRARARGIRGWGPNAWPAAGESSPLDGVELFAGEERGTTDAIRDIPAPRAEDVISHIVGDGKGWRELIAPTDESKDPSTPDATPADPLTPFELTQARVIAHAWPTQQVPIDEIPEQPRDPARVRRAIDALRDVEW